MRIGPGWERTEGRFVLLRHDLPRGENASIGVAKDERRVASSGQQLPQSEHASIGSEVKAAAKPSPLPRPPSPAVQPARSHWDLMFELEQSLYTLQLMVLPEPLSPGEGGAQPIHVAATRLFDHRLRYLEYEGAISDNRGWVRCWARGHYRLPRSNAAQENSGCSWVELISPQLYGRIALTSLAVEVGRSTELTITAWLPNFSSSRP